MRRINDLILEPAEGSQYLVGLAAIKMACSMPDSVPETVCITFNTLTVVSASECQWSVWFRSPVLLHGERKVSDVSSRLCLSSSFRR